MIELCRDQRRYSVANIQNKNLFKKKTYPGRKTKGFLDVCESVDSAYSLTYKSNISEVPTCILHKPGRILFVGVYIQVYYRAMYHWTKKVYLNFQFRDSPQTGFTWIYF